VYVLCRNPAGPVDDERVAAVGQALAVVGVRASERGSVASSTKLSSGDAICSPTRSAKGDRP